MSSALGLLKNKFNLFADLQKNSFKKKIWKIFLRIEKKRKNKFKISCASPEENEKTSKVHHFNELFVYKKEKERKNQSFFVFASFA